jgi:putative integral membrane protein (TIGR02587 family)
MTMEMWSLGFTMSRMRLAVLLAVTLPFLIALSHYRGFEPTATWFDDLRDSFIAYGIAFFAASVTLPLFGVLRWTMPLDEIAGKIALQAVPGSFGAMLARSQLAARDELEQEVRESYGFEIFLMAVGGLFLSLNVAPTDEIQVISARISGWQVLGLGALSLAAMHAIVYFLEFRGGHKIPGQATAWGLFLRYTVAGYATCLLVNLYVLWTFGRTDDAALHQVVTMALVLSFPAALGAASARLIL